MNTLQLYSLMECRLAPLTNYYGVLSCDQFKNSRLSFEQHETAVIIVNSLNSFNAGQIGHWILLLKKPFDGFFFHDSLGMGINSYFRSNVVNKFHHGLNNKQNRRVQGHSDLCGAYCLCFAFYMLVNNYDMDGYFKMFSSNFELNDIKIQDLFSSMYHACI